jgi:hypothetical protein
MMSDVVEMEKTSKRATEALEAERPTVIMHREELSRTLT